MSLDEVIAHRAGHLTAYQNAALAERYRALVDKVSAPPTPRDMSEALPRAAAVNYAKLLAYKDEYEVARLYTDGSFEKQLRDQFEGNFKLGYHLAPPLLPGRRWRRPPEEEDLRRWMMTGFRMLAGLKGLRGTSLDLFGYSHDRRLERALIAEYESDVETVLELLRRRPSDGNRRLSLPDDIRGYGPVKEKSVADAKARYAQLAADLASPPPAPRQIAAE